jgi:hypothetical protein
MREWVMEVALKWHRWTDPYATAAFLIGLFVLVPLGFFRRGRGWAGTGLHIGSYVLGLNVWLLGLGITFGSYGWIGLLIGFLFFAVGVVPMAIFAAFFKISEPRLGWELLLAILVVFSFRIYGIWLLTKEASEQEQRKLIEESGWSSES